MHEMHVSFCSCASDCALYACAMTCLVVVAVFTLCVSARSVVELLVVSTNLFVCLLHVSFCEVRERK